MNEKLQAQLLQLASWLTLVAAAGFVWEVLEIVWSLRDFIGSFP